MFRLHVQCGWMEGEIYTSSPLERSTRHLPSSLVLVVLAPPPYNSLVHLVLEGEKFKNDFPLTTKFEREPVVQAV